MRVLVIDDAPHVADTLRDFFVALGHESRSATSGVGALSIAQEFEPELVALDFHLPDLSGIDVARALRAAMGTAPFIVAVTGNVEHEVEGRCLESGFNGFVLKPLYKPVIAKLLDLAESHRALLSRTR